MPNRHFLKGRCILDNIATTKELIFSIHKRYLLRHVLNVDYAKALDTVDWDFLLDLLVAKGFGVRWVGWIMTIFAIFEGVHSYQWILERLYLLLEGS